jgi:putative flippase GtrA
MRSFTRNALTSVFTTALDFGVMTGLVEIFHVYYVIAVFCGTIAGAASNFFINRHWSFQATHTGPRWQLARFLPVQAGSSALSTAGVWVLTEHTHLVYVYSKIIVATLVYIVWNYPMNRWFVFRRWSKPS